MVFETPQKKDWRPTSRQSFGRTVILEMSSIRKHFQNDGTPKRMATSWSPIFFLWGLKNQSKNFFLTKRLIANLFSGQSQKPIKKKNYTPIIFHADPFDPKTPCRPFLKFFFKNPVNLLVVAEQKVRRFFLSSLSRRLSLNLQRVPWRCLVESTPLVESLSLAMFRSPRKLRQVNKKFDTFGVLFSSLNPLRKRIRIATWQPDSTRARTQRGSARVRVEDSTRDADSTTSKKSVELFVHQL